MLELLLRPGLAGEERDARFLEGSALGRAVVGEGGESAARLVELALGLERISQGLLGQGPQRMRPRGVVEERLQRRLRPRGIAALQLEETDLGLRRLGCG